MAGGAVSFFDYTDNTEVFSSGKWTKVEPLDMALTGLQGVTVDNNVYMIGEDIGSLIVRVISKMILEFSLMDGSFLFSYVIYILIGGQDSKEQDHSAIWKYDSEQKVWKLAMYMRNVKSLHGVSVVNYNDFC